MTWRDCKATLYSWDGVPVRLAGMLRTRPAFLICSGPSLKRMDLSHLQRRGIVTMGLNNSPAVVRPMFWTCVDAAGRFIPEIWHDPGIIKFAALHHFHDRFKVRRPQGGYTRSTERVGEMASVFGYKRNARFNVQEFLQEPTFNWGCGDGISDGLGMSGHRSVLLVALKMLYFLGAGTVFLLGADFHMRPDEQYAFPERNKTSGSNNSLYHAMNRRLSALRPHFERAGCRIFNATPGTRMTAFPQIGYTQAIECATKYADGSCDTEGLYR